MARWATYVSLKVSVRHRMEMEVMQRVWNSQLRTIWKHNISNPVGDQEVWRVDTIECPIPVRDPEVAGSLDVTVSKAGRVLGSDGLDVTAKKLLQL